MGILILSMEKYGKFHLASEPEESAQNCPVHIPVAAREIKGETELREMMKLRKMKIKEKENAGKR